MSSLIFSPTACPTTFHRQASHNTIVCSTRSTRNLVFHSCYNLVGDVKYAKCKAFYKASNKDSADVVHETDMPFGNKQHAIKKYVKEIASVFDLMEDGEITSSPYDTAWVALIKDVSRPNSGPHFPSCLNWIINNQLHDGSWGESLMFSAHDRLINTLACVVALTSWNVHPDKCQKGTEFVNENMKKLKDEDDEHMMIGFEIVFPVLIQLARKLDINVSADASILDEIYSKRGKKLSKIPMDKLHEAPTSLLHSLEGMEDLDWEKLLKLQCENGSFFFSPAATAFAFMQTKDHKCLDYLTNLVAKFKGGVPNVYPVDMFEHIWIVDRLQRLGIARHFQSEIKGCVDYVHRYWNNQGIGFARNTNVADIDDTAMGFRVLRTSGYQISPDVFRHFEKDGQFAAFPDNQTTEAVTGMYNLYRASQVLFPGEKILEDAKNFSHKFLTEKRSNNELLDKWIITKDLPGEVGYVLDVPWYASLPRLEARYYLEQYGGDDDIWIGKSLYRMGYVNNSKYLYMAKLDYNHCQSIHQLEYKQIQKWYANLNIEESSSTKLLWSYYEAASSIFEPNRCNERVAWAKTTIMLNIVSSFFASSTFSNDDKRAFVNEFSNTPKHYENEKPWHAVMDTVLKTLHQISSNTLAAHGVDIHEHLHRAWTTWLLSWQKEANMTQREGELIVRTIYLSSGRLITTEEALPANPFNRHFSLINDLYHRTTNKGNNAIGSEVELRMQELVQLVLNNYSPNIVDPDFGWTCLVVAKAFYYRAHFDTDTINHHINKVLFEKVI